MVKISPAANNRTGRLSLADRSVVSASRTQMLTQLGPVVYVIATHDGLVKIGFSSNLGRRYGNYAGMGQLVAWEPGATLDHEAEILDLLAPHVARGREWFHPTPEVLEVVYGMRRNLGIDRPLEVDLPVRG
jgi:hypothetical protein